MKGPCENVTSNAIEGLFAMWVGSLVGCWFTGFISSSGDVKPFTLPLIRAFISFLFSAILTVGR